MRKKTVGARLRQEIKDLEERYKEKQQAIKRLAEEMETATGDRKYELEDTWKQALCASGELDLVISRLKSIL